MSQKQWEQHMMPLLAQVPDGHLNFSNGGGGRDIQLYLTGDDPVLVEQTGTPVLEKCAPSASSRCAHQGRSAAAGNHVVHPRLDIAAQLGVSVQSISETIRIATLGRPAAERRQIFLDRPANSHPGQPHRKCAPRSDHAGESAGADRLRRERAAQIRRGFELRPGPFGRAPLQSKPASVSRSGLEPGHRTRHGHQENICAADLKHLPQGVHLVETGDTEFMNELYTNFMLAVGAGVLMVFAVLVLLFVRVLQPITILSALPLSLGGAVLALLLTGLPFSLPVVIGILMLMGIVAKNSILLVDFAIEEMRAGKSRLEAILESGHKRARPIVMTTVAMVAGMLPVAIGWGGDSDFRGPMAIAVIGGLITSTALTLVIVPAVFTVSTTSSAGLRPRPASCC
jgi:multidrug efflux pump subunit AcrB